MKKKIIVLLLAMSMTASIVGCGGNATPSDSSISTTDTKEESVVVEPTEEDSTEVSESVDDNIIEENSENTLTTDEEAESVENEETEEAEEVLSNTQRNSVNMLNYMTVLTQRINQSPNNQAFLEDAYSSLKNDLYPNAVDSKTQAQSTNLLDTINGYRMISVKRDRLEYIYEQNRAQALRQAIPNPMGLLSAVQSGSTLKMAASVLYMAVDAKSSYDSATSQADLQYLKDGWELDDESADELHNSTKNALNYMYNMVRDYDLPGDYALNDESVEAFVTWTAKDNLVSKISWLESNQNTYEQFGPYWLELVKDYYDSEDYENCLNALYKYEGISTRIFRKDLDYAKVLPMAIIAAKETMSESDYITFADKYCDLILSNTKKYKDGEDFDWSIRYFTAQIYIDLFAKTENRSYLENAYAIAFENVNILADGQRAQNEIYLADIKKVEVKKGSTKREKKEAKEYNKALEKERKIALPPVNESLYLNCDLLFALADEIDISQKEKDKIVSILHENNDPIFLTEALDNRFWFGKNTGNIKADDISIEFNGEKLIIPATCISDRSTISLTISNGKKDTVIDDWIVDEVKRQKKASVSDYAVTYMSEKAEKYKYQDGDVITISVTPVAESPDKNLVFVYNAKKVKKAFIINSIAFERKKK